MKGWVRAPSLNPLGTPSEGIKTLKFDGFCRPRACHFIKSRVRGRSKAVIGFFVVTLEDGSVLLRHKCLRICHDHKDI